LGVFLVLHNHVFFFMSCSQSQKWQIQVGFEIHDWLSSSILKSLATFFSKEFCQRILFWERIIRGLIWLWQIAKTPSILMLFRASYNSHLIKNQKSNSHSEIRYENFLKNSHIFFLSCTHFAKAIIILFCVLNLAEWIEKKIEIFQGGNHSFSGKSFLAMSFENSLF